MLMQERLQFYGVADEAISNISRNSAQDNRRATIILCRRADAWDLYWRRMTMTGIATGPASGLGDHVGPWTRPGCW